MNNNCWWWLLLKSNNYLSNRSINYAIIINKCSIACIVKTFSSSLVSSIWLNVAQQNLHSSQTLFHLWNSVFYSFLVPFANFLSQWWQLNGCSKMRSQVVLLDEFLITVVAVEWFFTSVNPFMHSQVVLLDEFLVTVEL